MLSPSAGSTEARPVVVEDDEQSFQARLLMLEERERRAAEAEKLARDSGCRIMMDGKMVPLPTLEAEATCASLEGPVALASKADLERILLRICSVSDVAKAIATKMLPTTTMSASSTVATGSKRKASDAETIYRCTRCKLRFGTDKNLPKDCRYHPGDKEVDDEAQRSDDDMDFWADHDEDCHGIKEDLADEPDYARGFIWSCCDRRGDAAGCEVREHDVWIKRTGA